MINVKCHGLLGPNWQTSACYQNPGAAIICQFYLDQATTWTMEYGYKYITAN